MYYSIADLETALFIKKIAHRKFAAVGIESGAISGNLCSLSDIRWSMRVIEFFRNIRNRAKKLVSIGVSYCEAIKTVWSIIKGKIEDIVDEVVKKYRYSTKAVYTKVQKPDETGEYRNIMSNRSTKHRLKMSCLERSRSMYNQITLW